MARLCERPGCSAPAACVYGIDSRRLSVWIDATVPDEAGSSSLGKRAGVLCRRHADSMVVPIGWILDDRRDAASIQPVSVRATPLPRIVRRRARRVVDVQSEQLALLDVPIDRALPGDDAIAELHVPAVAASDPSSSGPVPATAPWRPVFDQTDDLGGLLSTRSPLLSRAFGKRAKPSADSDHPAQ